jgi:tRNA dimethylallyltransferase
LSRDNDKEKAPLLVLVGPTAVGKTTLAVELALRLQGEIVTADSMQVYRGLDIGTAKPTREEQRGVPHWLIDVVDCNESFNVAKYRELAHKVIAEINKRGHLPILSGGTGLYVKAVLNEFLFPDQGASPEIREQLLEDAENYGPYHLHERLAQVDPETAERLHPHDVRRVSRALELYLRTGVPMSVQIAQAQASAPPYRVLSVGLIRERSHLHERINRRVLQMIEQGLIEEAQRLFSHGYLAEGTVAGQALGYKEIRDYIEGKSTLDEAIARLQQATRQYAKRQMTWFRRDQSIHWFDLDTYETPEAAAEAIVPLVKEKLQWPKLTDTAMSERN